MSTSILYLGLVVHKDSVTVAVSGAHDREPRLLDKPPYDLRRIRGCRGADGLNHAVARDQPALQKYGTTGIPCNSVLGVKNSAIPPHNRYRVRSRAGCSRAPSCRRSRALPRGSRGRLGGIAAPSTARR